jgi:hypothetical protein
VVWAEATTEKSAKRAREGRRVSNLIIRSSGGDGFACWIQDISDITVECS